MTLWSRVIVNHLTAFTVLRNSVIYHIPHQYSDVMKHPVPEVSARFSEYSYCTRRVGGGRCKVLPLCKLFRYALQDRVWFIKCSVLK